MKQTNTIAIYALTRQGMKLARRLAADLDGTLYALDRYADETTESFDSLTSLVGETFHKHGGHVFVAAAGIVIRCISPHLESKERDPAVVCMDQQGRYAVSLLSGHLGGANELALQCARSTGGQAVVTTATDSAGVLSMDMLAAAKGLVIGNIDRVKDVNGALLDERTVQLYDPENRLGLSGDGRFQTIKEPETWLKDAPGVWVSWAEDCPDGNALRLYPKSLHLGVGCRRGIPKEEILAHVTSVFEDRKLSLKSIASFGSVEAKRDEPGLVAAARELGVEPVFYTTSELSSVKTPSPSNKVRIHMGVPSVAEASAMLSSGGGELIVNKEKTKTVTLGVARSNNA